MNVCEDENVNNMLHLSSRANDVVSCSYTQHFMYALLSMLQPCLFWRTIEDFLYIELHLADLQDQLTHITYKVTCTSTSLLKIRFHCFLMNTVNWCFPCCFSSDRFGECAPLTQNLIDDSLKQLLIECYPGTPELGRKITDREDLNVHVANVQSACWMLHLVLNYVVCSLPLARAQRCFSSCFNACCLRLP